MDPFKNFKPLNSFSQAKKNSSTRTSDNFIEQVRDIGGSAVDSFKNDVVKGTAQTIFDQLLGSAKSGQVPENNANPTENLEQIIAEREARAKEEGRQEERVFLQRTQKEEKVLFSMTDEKLRREIDSVRQEMALLVKTMGKVETQIEKAMTQEVVDGGVYHLNFFKNLKAVLVMWRKSMEDASTWMSMASGRGKQKSFFWKQEARSGTKYTLSSERYMQMSAG